uniref:Uncharacterized protein n=1 Tax=Arundo donax TaxID=35708 RepID=A0A0A9BBF4_ARUDO
MLNLIAAPSHSFSKESSKNKRKCLLKHLVEHVVCVGRAPHAACHQDHCHRVPCCLSCITTGVPMPCCCASQ